MVAVRVGLLEKVTFHAKTEEGEEGTHADTWRESILGGETSQGVCLGCLCLSCLAEREGGGGGE